MIPTINFFNSKENKAFLEQLKEQFGITKLPGRVTKIGKEKIFLFAGNLEEDKIMKMQKLIPIERIGIYLAKEFEREYRLSIEGTQILKDQITKNVIELNEEQKETWMMGHELLMKTDKKGFVIIKYKEDMLGTGKASEEKIANFIPKSRRLKDKTIEK